MKTLSRFAALCCGLAVGAALPGQVFEQVAAGPRGAWRSRGAAPEIVVLADGFLLRRGDSVQRFRWDRSMNIENLVAEEPVSSNSYLLAGDSGKARPLRHARRVRAASSDGGLAVLYYFGTRGLEFDIEAAPNTPLPNLLLESVDGDFSVNADGHLAVDGQPLALQPVAYSTDSSGARHAVSVAYRVDHPRRLVFEIGAYDPARRLVIDPVMTYATYFAGSADEGPVALRELADGSVLFAGNTSSIDLPQGASLNSVLMQPAGVSIYGQCFVTRVSPASKRIHFTAYLGNARLLNCQAMDLDSSGRILLAGYSDGSAPLATANAQYRSAKYNPEGFLARISADGETLEYATYLGLDCHNSPLFLRAGPGETVYLGFSTCSAGVPDIPGYKQTPGPVLLLRYNIAGRRFDQRSFFGDGEATLRGIELAPGGAVFAYGRTSSTAFPVLNPIQSSPPTSGAAGFVAALSGDLRTLLFASYLGGQSLHTSISAALAAPDGTVWLSGSAYEGSIPGLQPARPFQEGANESLFAMQVAPGRSTPLKAFLAGGYISDRGGAIFLSDGRYCLAMSGADSSYPAAAGGAALAAPSVGSMLGCLNEAASDFQMLTPTGTGTFPETVIAASRAGGIWSLQIHPRGGFGDIVPYDFKQAAIQPLRPDVSPDTDELLLRYIDLATPRPVLGLPQPLRLLDLQVPAIFAQPLSGRNFAVGMQLDTGGKRIAIQAIGPTAATLHYRSPGVEGNEPLLGLRAGHYTGQLVIPTQPPAVSDSFAVVVANLPPALAPFETTTQPRVFRVNAPVYADSRAMWKGRSLPLTSGPGGGMQVEIPVDLAQPGAGDLTLINPPPGGGVQRRTIILGDTESSVPPPSFALLSRVRADHFQVDRSRRILYTLLSPSIVSPDWILSEYTLPDAQQRRSVSILKDGAVAAVDLKLSVDGRFLYLADNRLRIRRFRTDSLAGDLDFHVPTDSPLDFDRPETRHALRMLEDAPESVLVVTPAGRMILYDRDQPRRYSTTDFPSAIVRAFDPVLAASGYVYAVQRADRLDPPPCVARYPIDTLGFAPPEHFCDFAADWGKYPEMKLYAGTVVLQNGAGAAGIRLTPEFEQMRLQADFDIARGIAVRTEITSYDFSTGAATYRLVFLDLHTGEPIGHFPPADSLMGYATSVTFLDDDTMVFGEQALGRDPAVVIVPRWRTLAEWYP